MQTRQILPTPFKRRLVGFRAVLLAGIAPLFGFTAIACGLVRDVTVLSLKNAVLTILWAWLFLGEKQIRPRLLGAGIIIIGGMLMVA